MGLKAFTMSLSHNFAFQEAAAGFSIVLEFDYGRIRRTSQQIIEPQNRGRRQTSDFKDS